jgi:hypothetical protein
MPKANVVAFETIYHSDYDPDSHKAQKHERVDVAFFLRRGALIVNLTGGPFLDELELTLDPVQALTRLSELLEDRELERLRSATLDIVCRRAEAHLAAARRDAETGP